MRRTSDAGLSDRLRQAFEARDDAEILHFLARGRTMLSYTGGELGAVVEREARLLRERLGPGPRVVMLALPAGERFLTTLLACLVAEIAVVPTPLPRRGSASDRFAFAARDCGATAILCLPEAEPTLAEALVKADDPRPPPPVTGLPLEAASLPEDLPVCTEAADGAAVIQYTSGSTRAPKGVRIAGRNILANCELVMRHWGMHADTRMVNWLPHYHDMGLMGGILYPLLCGGVSFQMSPFDFVRRPGVWLSVIDEARATFSGGPAFAFAEVIRRVSRDEIAELDLSCWRRAFCGAEPVPPRLLDDFHAHLAPSDLPRAAVFACYGIAEMTLFAAGRPDNAESETRVSENSESCLLDAETRAGISIVDPETCAELPDGQEGEIWLSGPSQGLGYLNLPEETELRFRRRRAGEAARAWLRTGDLGRVSHGRLFVTGRLKDVLICQGRKLSAPEVEWLACAAHEGLNAMAAVAFMPDPNMSGRAVLVAETHRDAPAPEDAPDLKHRIRQSVLGEWGLELTDILFVPRGRLDRTTSGKIRRQAVAAAYRDGRLTTLAEEEAAAWL